MYSELTLVFIGVQPFINALQKQADEKKEEKKDDDKKKQDDKQDKMDTD